VCGVLQEEAYAKQLERLLRRHLQVDWIDVLNAGQDGYSTFQGRRLVRNDLLALGPDVVIAAFGTNDASPADRCDADTQARLGRAAVWVQRQLLRSPLLATLSTPVLWLKYRAADAFGPKPDPAARTVLRVSPADYESNLSDICAAVAAQAGRVVILSIPKSEAGRIVPCFCQEALETWALSWPDLARAYTEATERVADEHGAMIVDPLPGFVERHRQGLSLHLDHCHPTPLGHRLLALELAQALTNDERFQARLSRAQEARKR